MYCEKCGSQIDDDSVFCSKCGGKQADIFGTSKNNNSESSDINKIEAGSMLYVIKPDTKLPPVGYKVKVTAKHDVDGKKYISAIGPYKPDGTPMPKVKKMYALDIAYFSTNPPTQEIIQRGNSKRSKQRGGLAALACLPFVIIIGVIIFGVLSDGSGSSAGITGAWVHNANILGASVLVTDEFSGNGNYIRYNNLATQASNIIRQGTYTRSGNTITVKYGYDSIATYTYNSSSDTIIDDNGNVFRRR